ncbi:MAG: hypothetical protein NTW25_16030 [Candidatus Kapabacteria bacterium]|nr:hypothetical protein [Candidatus Kapabacteria bacterium]
MAYIGDKLDSNINMFKLIFILYFLNFNFLKSSENDSLLNNKILSTYNTPKKILYAEFLGNTGSLIAINYEFLTIDKINFTTLKAESYTRIGYGIDIYFSIRQSVLIHQNLVFGDGSKNFELGLGAFYNFLHYQDPFSTLQYLDTGIYLSPTIAYRSQPNNKENNTFFKLGICPIYSFKDKKIFGYSVSICYGITL